MNILDILWEKVIKPVFDAYEKKKPLQTYPGKRRGKRPIPVRIVFNTVLYILITGAIWNSISGDGKTLCNGNTAHHIFREWAEGV